MTFSPPKETRVLALLLPWPLLTQQPLGAARLLSLSADSPLLHVHYKWDHTIGNFFVRFTHVITCQYFLFMAK